MATKRATTAAVATTATAVLLLLRLVALEDGKGSSTSSSFLFAAAAAFVPALRGRSAKMTTTTTTSSPTLRGSASTGSVDDSSDIDRFLDGDLTSLSREIRSGRVSAVQVAEATLRRIERRNPRSNAVILLRDRESLLRQARNADAELMTIRKGLTDGISGTNADIEKRKWLLGIPLAVKDLSDVAGIPTTMGGSPNYENYVPTRSDPFVASLQAAGAIIIGKTNAPELGLGSHTANRRFGTTRNPYDPTRTAGGSSGGAAVAVAAGMLPAADGSDTMGSLRNPAGWNNLYSIRPTAGMFDEPSSDDDDGNSTKANPLEYPYSTVGCIGRSVRDLGRFLQTMLGDDASARFVPPSLDDNDDDGGGNSKAIDRTSATDRSYRIAWLGDWDGHYPMDDGILDRCRSALQEGFSSNEIEVVDLSNAPLFDAEKIWSGMTTIRSSIFASDFAASNQQRAGGTGTAAERLSENVEWEVLRGAAITESELQAAANIAKEWSETLDGKVFEQFDAVALPSAQVWPFSVENDNGRGGGNGGKPPKQINGIEMDSYHRWMEICAPASLAGLPCVTIPAGFSGDSYESSKANNDSVVNEYMPQLPIGIQLMGKRWDDAKLLRIAHAYHRATDWPSKWRPPLPTPPGSE